jgi:hypothetical protein
MLIHSVVSIFCSISETTSEKSVKNLFWSESKKLLMALEDKRIPPVHELDVVKCTNCKQAIADSFCYENEGI